MERRKRTYLPEAEDHNLREESDPDESVPNEEPLTVALLVVGRQVRVQEARRGEREDGVRNRAGRDFLSFLSMLGGFRRRAHASLRRRRGYSTSAHDAIDQYLCSEMVTERWRSESTAGGTNLVRERATFLPRLRPNGPKSADLERRFSAHP